MPTPVEVGFEANGQQSVTRAWDVIKKGIEDNIRALAKIAPEAKAAEQAEKDLGKAAERWLQAVQTPQQRYNQKLTELQSLLKAGKLSQEQYNRAVSQTSAELRSATAEQHKFGIGGKAIHGNMAGLIAGSVAAYALLQKAISAVTEEQQRFNDGIEKTADMLAEQELKLQIQAGILPSQVEAQMPMIQKALQATPVVDVNRAIQIQTQAASSGFKQADVDSGEALKATLDVMAATNQFGAQAADPKTSMQSISMYLKGSSGQTPDAAAIRHAGGNLATIFKESDVQFEDLQHLAKQASTLTNAGLSQEEQFAAFSATRDVFGAEKGGMGLKGYVMRTATAGSDKTKTKALADLGFKPEDVDIAAGGDQLIPTLKKMSAALAQKSAEEQQSILNQIYGEEVQSQAAFLLRPETIQKIEDRVAAQQNSTLLDDNVKIFQGSRFARGQRTKNSQTFSERNIDQQRGGTHYKELVAEDQAYTDQLYAEGKINGLQRTYGSIKTRVDNAVYQTLGYNPTKIEDVRAERLQNVDQNSAYAQGGRADQSGQAELQRREQAAAAKQPPVNVNVNVNIKRSATANPKTPNSAAIGQGRM